MWMLIKPYLGEIIGVIGMIITYFIGNRTRKIADLKSTEEITSVKLDNVEHGLEIYKQIMVTLEENLKQALNKLDDAQSNYETLKNQLTVIEEEKRKCDKEKAVLKQENLDFYRKLNTCNIDCKLKK